MKKSTVHLDTMMTSTMKENMQRSKPFISSNQSSMTASTVELPPRLEWRKHPLAASGYVVCFLACVAVAYAAGYHSVAKSTTELNIFAKTVITSWGTPR